jgi:beta-lactamase class A
MFTIIWKNIKKSWLPIVFSVIIGATLGFYLHTPKIQTLQRLEARSIPDPDSSYPLINPLLGYDSVQATNFGQLVTFKANITKLVNQEIAQNNVSQMSVYFRDLNIGHWIGINDMDKYSPASLLKVPLMIAYYHLSETDPGILDKEILFNVANDTDEEQNIVPAKKLQTGQSYSVEDLIEDMITNSDNDATQLLLYNIDPKVFNQVFLDMNITLPTTGDGAQDFISVRSYALLFRVLYASTYLTHSDSEKVLELMSKSAFKDGLVSAVPSNIAVAHKFGERASLDPTNNTIVGREFHDCGIIYYPQEPYLLCVMTKGSNLANLEKSVNDVSKLIYTQVKNGVN